MDYLKFKSGSDIRGYGIGDETNPLFISDKMVKATTIAFYKWLGKKIKNDEIVISVGRDCRVSGERIAGAVIDALGFCKVSVIDCGLCSTPAMFMTTVELDCDAAVQITASHHPMDRNGLKFFTRDGGLDASDIEEILSQAQKYENIDVPSNKEVTKLDFITKYSEILRNMIISGVDNGDKPLSGMKIVVDAGNGVGGFYAEKVLAPLGADVSSSVYLTPDGTFPNHIPNPENAVAMQMASDACKKAGADLGVVFDTDVDRAAIVGADGLEINRNRLVALASKVALEKYPGGTIVTDSVTSDGLAKFIKENGGVHLRYKRGYRNVINKQLELCNNLVSCPLAMETSGHAAFAENYFLDDGAYLVTRLIIKAAQMAKKGEKLEDLIKYLEEPKEEKEIRFKILKEDFKPEGENVIRHFIKQCDEIEDWTACEDNFEGIRINSKAGDGWFLLRLSVHDPIIVLNCESNSQGGIEKMLQSVYSVLKTADNIDSIEI